MRRFRWTAAALLLGGFLGSTAFGQIGMAPLPDQATWGQSPIHDRGGYYFDDYYYTAAEDDAATKAPPQAPAPDPAEQPAASAGCGVCSNCMTGCPSSCASCCDQPYRLFDLQALRCRRIEIGGWLDQGITANPDRPQVVPFNGPVTFNDRANEYQMNQLYLYAERVARTGGYGFDVGGRVDFLYGTDHRFTTARGLEDDWNGDRRFYGLAMPQLYADVALNRLTVRMGHFYTILGYESVMAPQNFFYSHAYAHQYGEPFTHTGMLAIYDLNDCWSFSGGFDRGWDNWEDNNNDLSFLGGVTWTSPSKNTSVGFAMTLGDEDDLGENTRFVYSLVLKQRLTDRLTYILHHNLGHEQNAADGQDAEWYGLNNYLLYELNRRWSFGLRYEWFSDDDGVRVAGLGLPQGIPLDPVPSHWHALSLGLNYKFNANVMWRSECRWDWVDPLVAVDDGPFDDFTDRSQFLWGNDLIIRF